MMMRHRTKFTCLCDKAPGITEFLLNTNSKTDIYDLLLSLTTLSKLYSLLQNVYEVGRREEEKVELLRLATIPKISSKD
jgi:hypothetical protein